MSTRKIDLLIQNAQGYAKLYNRMMEAFMAEGMKQEEAKHTALQVAFSAVLLREPTDNREPWEKT